jgi:hypothetical protein
MLDDEERDSFDDVQVFERQAEQELISRLCGQLDISNGMVGIKPDVLAAKLRALTPAETTPDINKAPETLFTCYYKPPPETLKLPPSPISMSSRSPSVC